MSSSVSLDVETALLLVSGVAREGSKGARAPPSCFMGHIEEFARRHPRRMKLANLLQDYSSYVQSTRDIMGVASGKILLRFIQYCIYNSFEFVRSSRSAVSFSRLVCSRISVSFVHRVRSSNCTVPPSSTALDSRQVSNLLSLIIYTVAGYVKCCIKW